MPVFAGSPYVSLKGSLGTTDTGDIKLSHVPEGLVNTTDSSSDDTTTSTGLAIGYDTGDVRFEFEYMDRSKLKHDTSLYLGSGGVDINGTYYPFGGESIEDFLGANFNIDGSIKTETFFLNVYAESDVIFGYKLPVEIYAGAGVGMAEHTSKISYTISNPNGPEYISFSDGDISTCVAYNVQVGATYLFTDNIGLDLGLRYADLGEAQLGSNLEADSIVVKEVIVGFRYTF